MCQTLPSTLYAQFHLIFIINFMICIKYTPYNKKNWRLREVRHLDQMLALRSEAMSDSRVLS